MSYATPARHKAPLSRVYRSAMVEVDLTWLPHLINTNSVVTLLGDARRENALMQILDRAKKLNPFLPTQWITVSHTDEDPHTGARPDRKVLDGVLGISFNPPIEGERTEPSPDVVHDLVAAHRGLVIVASERPIPHLRTVVDIDLAYKQNWRGI